MNDENYDKIDQQHLLRLLIIFYIFFIYIKIPKDSSAKYYQNNKERLKKKARERYQSISKEEKEKNDNMVAKVTKIYQKMKNKGLLIIEKIIIK